MTVNFVVKLKITDQNWYMNCRSICFLFFCFISLKRPQEFLEIMSHYFLSLIKCTFTDASDFKIIVGFRGIFWWPLTNLNLINKLLLNFFLSFSALPHQCLANKSRLQSGQFLQFRGKKIPTMTPPCTKMFKQFHTVQM